MTTPTVILTDLNDSTSAILELMSPGVAHFHAIASTLGAGDLLNAKIEWDFDDPSGDYNELRGFNAAHFYAEVDEQTDYAVRCTITNVDGETAYAERTVRMTPNTRTKVYIDPSTGSASPSDPSDPDDAYDTLAHAYAGTSGSNYHFVLTAGATHVYGVTVGDKGTRDNILVDSSTDEPFLIQPANQTLIGTGHNCLIRNAHVLTGSTTTMRILDPRGGSPPTLNSAAINVTSENTTVLALVSSEGSRGVLLQGVTTINNTALNNLFTGPALDVVVLDAFITHAGTERAMRVSATRCLIHDSWSRQTSNQKNAFTRENGQYLYLSQSWLRANAGAGALALAHSTSLPEADPEWIVVERCLIEMEGTHTPVQLVQGEQGLRHAVMRNNIILHGYIWIIQASASDRMTEDIRIYNNTMIPYPGTADPMRIYFPEEYARVSDIKYENNLAVNLSWITPTARNSIMFRIPADQIATVGYSILNNVHYPANSNQDVRIPNSIPGGSAVRISMASLNTDYDCAAGNLTKDVVIDGSYRPDTSDTDILKTPPDDMAQFAEDYYGNPRTGGAWVVGAVGEESSESLQWVSINTAGGSLMLSYTGVI